jgi:hypothetical protein
VVAATPIWIEADEVERVALRQHVGPMAQDPATGRVHRHPLTAQGKATTSAPSSSDGDRRTPTVGIIGASRKVGRLVAGCRGSPGGASSAQERTAADAAPGGKTGRRELELGAGPGSGDAVARESCGRRARASVVDEAVAAGAIAEVVKDASCA